MHLFRPVSVLLAALLALGACADPTAPDDATPVPGEVRAQLRRWEALGLRDYRFTVERTCFCAPEHTQPARVEVRGGKVAAVVSLRTGRALDTRVGFTVAELFAWIARAQEEGTYLEVRYHPVQGYPMRAVIGTLANDAGVAYALSGLEPLR